jgi:pimeloyl-ACP methyl ester carboxylesterase
MSETSLYTMVISKTVKRWDRGQIKIGRERLDYSIVEIDARNEVQGGDYVNHKTLNGDLFVYLPGHGQRVHDAANLLEYTARRSPAHLVWSIDIAPPAGGDPVKAAAFVKLVYWKIQEAFSISEEDLCSDYAPVGITLFGYSHGGGIALRAAEMAPKLVKNVVDFCPVGLLGRTPRDLVMSASKESRHILMDALGGYAEMTSTIKLAAGSSLGLFGDFARTKSLRRLVDDALWVNQKITGDNYGYTGNVILLFARNDSLIRWQSVFPECSDPGDIEHFVREYQRSDFPHVSNLMVRVLEGNHLSPLVDVSLYIDTVINLLKRLETESEIPNFELIQS